VPRWRDDSSRIRRPTSATTANFPFVWLPSGLAHPIKIEMGRFPDARAIPVAQSRKGRRWLVETAATAVA
jgi:hypothetical protein